MTAGRCSSSRTTSTAGSSTTSPRPAHRNRTCPTPCLRSIPTGEPFYGPRVPTFAIGPFVRPGAVDSTVYDHTSIIATILRRFVGEFPAELGPRPALANHVGHLLELDQPRPAPTITRPGLPDMIRGFRDLRPDPDGFHAGMRALAQPPRR